MEWFDLINETLKAFLIIPLYSILNKIIKNDEKNFANHTVKTGLITFIVYTVFSIGVLIYGEVLMKAMNTNETDLGTINRYLQLEPIAFMIGILISFVNVVFVVVGKDRNVYIFLGVKTVLSLFADLLFISNLGVYGVALSNIIVNSVLAITSFALLYRQRCIRFCRFKKSDLAIIKDWCKTGAFSGIQQFVDNLIYDSSREHS